MSLIKRALPIAFLVPFGLAASAVFGACGSDPSTSGSGGSGASGNPGGGNPGGGNTGGAGTAGSGVGGFGTAGNQGSGGLNEDAACVATEAEATLEKKPVDIVFIIDNSGSMGDNIESVQNNINDNFAAIIGASGIDYRVIMISEHGNLGAESICVKAPLSSTSCMPVPAEPGQNAPIFYQYSIPISSHDSFCKALNAYDGTLPDQFGYEPGGWKQWLRADSYKVFVEVTDDGASCSENGNDYDDNDNEAGGEVAGNAWDQRILALDPAQFGTAEKRNYVFHSIVGLAEGDPADSAYAPDQPVVTGVCGTAVAAGTAYQTLSKLTGGLRFPICQFASFDVVFQEIAKGVIEGATVACEFPVPEAPPGETIDLETVVLAYTPGSGGPTQKMKQVASAAACEPSAFYIEAGVIKLCEEACSVVQADKMAKVTILFGCKQDIN